MQQQGSTPSQTERSETCRVIRAALKRRSGKAWSVTGGRGTVWGWITITAPRSRQLHGTLSMTEDDRAELSRLLGKPVHEQGESFPRRDWAQMTDRANADLLRASGATEAEEAGE